jgi:drug/metabolite transporter (DMT)-like permease
MIAAHPRPAERSLGLALILLSGSAFGTLALFARLAYAAGVDPLTLLCLRFGLAAVMMGAVIALRPRPLPSGRVLLTLAAMGGVGYVAQSMAYFTALTLVPASLVALLLYLYPGLVTALSVLVIGERVSAPRVGALLCALAGTALTIGPSAGGHPLGIAIALAAACIYAVYILVGSRVTARAEALPATAVILTSAALSSGALTLLHGPALPHTAAGWGAIVGIALVSTILPILTFFAGLARVGPTTAATLSTVEPLVTVLLATLFLRETLGPQQVVGGLFILGAVLMLARSGNAPSGAAS